MTNAAILASYRESPLEVDELVDGEVWSNIGGLYRLLVDVVVPGSEVMYGFQWLEATLSADSTLAGYAPGGIWRALAPPREAIPFVIMAHQTGTDVITVNAFRIMTEVVYQVKIVGPASMTSTLMAGASRIDQLIGSPPASGTV